VRRCPRERESHAAAASGRWTPALAAHARECRACGDVRLVAAVLQSAPPGPAPRADPRTLWVSARHARRLTAEARVSFIVMAAQVSVLAAALGALLSLVPSIATQLPVMLAIRTDAVVVIGSGIAFALVTAGLMRWMSRRA
jgi:hypothetical protein